MKRCWHNRPSERPDFSCSSISLTASSWLRSVMRGRFLRTKNDQPRDSLCPQTMCSAFLAMFLQCSAFLAMLLQCSAFLAMFLQSNTYLCITDTEYYSLRYWG
ncbi:hypothetical protein BaRGS_00034303 [Batillaria attramentaria]|uniref:Uncharacterized protein n=1 Tax=Batillaria attramentaria TaxID=370345 RepID=A0ABD0JIG1_9CAEN